MGGVINIITSPADARGCSRSQAAVRQPRAARSSTFWRADRWNKAGRARRRQLLQDGRISHRRADRTRADRQQRRRRLSQRQRARSSTRRRTASTRSSAPATSARIGTTARSASSTTRGGRPSTAASALRLPDGSDLQGRVFVDVSARPLQLPGRDQPGHDPQPRPPGDRSARADQRRRRRRWPGPRP